MRLREKTRPPNRYISDTEFLVTDHRRLPRNATNTKAKNHVDYNPHLPPAAFPTLDKPLPAGQSPPPSRRPAASQVQDHDADSPDLDPFPHIPSESLDNFIASNGPQNPQYRKNMALLERKESSDIEVSSDEDEDGDSDELELSDSDDIGDYHDEESKLPDNPQWHELSLGLQIEIAENMLETHEMTKIRVLLGLNQCDIEELIRNLNKRNEDVEYENDVLEDMQNKQLRALMCLDNSDLKMHSVPARLIMSRKSWTQCHRVVQKNSRMKYLLCQAGNLQNARRFLSRRGLPMTYAGEWDNQFVANPSVSNNTGIPEAFKWRSIPSPSTSVVPVSEANRSGSKEIPGPSVEEQIDIQNSNSSAINNESSSPRQNGGLPRHFFQQGLNNRYSQIDLPRQSIVRLKIGAKNAARIQTGQLPMSHRCHTDISNAIFPKQMDGEPNSDDTIVQSPPKLARPIPIQGHFTMPVRRKLGCWSTDKNRLQPPMPVLPPTTDPDESLDGIPYDLTMANQWANQTSQFEITDVVNEKTYGFCVPESVSAFDFGLLQSPDLPSSEAIVDENVGDLVSKNTTKTFGAFTGVESSSWSRTEVTSNAADENQISLSKMGAGVTPETPNSSQNVNGNMKLQPANITYEHPASLPNSEPASERIHFNSTAFSKPGYVVLKTKQHREPVEKAEVTDVMASMVSEDPSSSIPAQSSPTAKSSKQDTEASSLSIDKEDSFIDDELESHIITHNIPKQVAGLSKAPEQETGFLSSLESHGGIKEAPHKANSIDSVVGKDLSGNHSAICDNVTVEIPLRNTKTRQMTRKRATGNRNASDELLAAQPKRSKNCSDTVVTQRVLRGRPVKKNEQRKSI